MKSESWLPVPGYEGRYSVSDMGDVMSMDWYGTGLLKILKPSISSGGYFRVTLHKNKVQKTAAVHALVLLAFVGPRPPGMDINHKNGIKTDNRPSNLEYCSTSQNVRHAYANGLRAGGYGRKLLPSEVIEIKNKISSGMNKVVIAKEHNISKTTVHRIANGESWANIIAETLQ